MILIGLPAQLTTLVLQVAGQQLAGQGLCFVGPAHLGRDGLDGQCVVAVPSVGTVVDESYDPLGRPERVDAVVAVADLMPVGHSVDAEGDAEVAVDRRTDSRHEAVMSVEAGHGQDVGVSRDVADDDGVLGLDVAVEARQYEAVVGLLLLEEVGHGSELSIDERTPIFAYLVEDSENAVRVVGTDDRVVTEFLDNGRTTAVPSTAA